MGRLSAKGGRLIRGEQLHAGSLCPGGAARRPSFHPPTALEATGDLGGHATRRVRRSGWNAGECDRAVWRSAHRTARREDGIRHAALSREVGQPAVDQPVVEDQQAASLHRRRHHRCHCVLVVLDVPRAPHRALVALVPARAHAGSTPVRAHTTLREGAVRRRLHLRVHVPVRVRQGDCVAWRLERLPERPTACSRGVSPATASCRRRPPRCRREERRR